jgi:hypothetical protein
VAALKVPLEKKFKGENSAEETYSARSCFVANWLGFSGSRRGG